ncbi:MAG: hypothetical protein K2Q09_04915, partial [Phycisphaerales bacterium]|nr:hypothetical protein [Phycisphaerales bacterium]
AGGVLDTAAPGATPLRIELADFTFQGGGNVLAMFPIFAELHRSAGEANRGPALIASRQLRLPLDGDMRKFSGVLEVDIGRVDYEFSRGLGDFLDTTVFAGGRGDEQRPLPRFTITIDQGVVRYGSVAEKVSLPVRNLDFKMRGVVDLVNKRLDVVTYVPTVAAAPGLVGNLNSTVGGFLGKLVPNAVERFTEIPVRTEGPMGQTTTAYAPQLVLEEGKSVLNDIGRGLVGAPGDIIKGIGDLLGGEKQKPAPKKPPGGPSPGNPPGQPGKPSPPKG